MFRLALFALLQAAPSAQVELSPQLAAWRSDIERQGGGRVVVARVHTKDGAMTLPEDAEQRALLRELLIRDDLRGRFSRTHALNVNLELPAGRFHIVLVNDALARRFGDNEEALLAHELGHIWLVVNGLPLIAYAGGERGCQSMLAGDMVQHVLIRAELGRRGIDYEKSWVPQLRTTLEYLRATPPSEVRASPPCRRIELAAMLADIYLGLDDATWPDRDEFLCLLRNADPEMAEPVLKLADGWRIENLADPAVYRRAIEAAWEAAGRAFAGQ